MIQRIESLCGMMLVTLIIGCAGGDDAQPIDTSGAEFSNAEDYAAYDIEMAKLEEGQSE